jgi:hypothetical protein
MRGMRAEDVKRDRRRGVKDEQFVPELSGFYQRRSSALGFLLRRVQRDGGTDEGLQCFFINLVSLVEIDGTPGVAFEAGVEEA